ncbi:MAG TPA: MarR family transcriptional regulator [Euzebya sp.]|nr:MarR family transcriptional regulator [Euzebya sp.]
MDEEEAAAAPRAGRDLGVATWSAFLRAHAAVLRVLEREVEAETGLALSWYDVLLELSAAEHGRLRMQVLASRVVLSRTRVSRLVDDLSRAGLVTKTPDPADGRATFATITDAGRRAQRLAAPAYLRGIQRHFAGHLSRAQLEAMRAGLAQVLAAHPPDAPGRVP